jgi:CBS domain-containing protein/biotin operon repressor
VEGFSVVNFSERQLRIITIVKNNEPISGEEIAKNLSVAKATLRNDLSLLTMTGVLDARPKVGYFYSGQTVEPLLFEKLFHTKVESLMMPPMIVKQDMSIYDAIVTLFMYDVGSLYVANEKDELSGIVSRKDLLRATINNGQLSSTPVAVIMTRSPNIITVKKDIRVLDAGYLLLQHKVDSLPVVADKADTEIIGKITKTVITEYFIKSGLDIENKE